MTRPPTEPVRISAGQLSTALDRLGTTPDEYRTMTAHDFGQLLDAYLRDVQEWIARDKGRTDRIRGARDLAQGTPKDMTIWAAEQEGFIPPGTHRRVMQVLAEVQAESQADPNPSSPDVRALIFALHDAMRGSEQAVTE